MQNMDVAVSCIKGCQNKKITKRIFSFDIQHVNVNVTQNMNNELVIRILPGPHD